MKKQLLILGFVTISTLTLSGCATVEGIKKLQERCPGVESELAALQAKVHTESGQQKDVDESQIRYLQSQLSFYSCNNRL